MNVMIGKSEELFWQKKLQGFKVFEASKFLTDNCDRISQRNKKILNVVNKMSSSE